MSNLNDSEEKGKNGNKKDILRVITKKIENDNLNLNNPGQFYSQVFMKFMDRKLTKIKEDDPNSEMNKEEKDFILRMESMVSLKYDPNRLKKK